MDIDLMLSQQRYKDAIKLAQEYLSRNPEDDEQQVFYLQRLSDIHLELNDPQQALKYLIRLITLMSQLRPDDYQTLGGIYTKIGKACFYSCHYEQSEFFLQKAKKMLEDHNFSLTNEMAMTLVQLGNYSRFMFQDSQAEQLILKSIEIRLKLYGTQSYEIADSYHGLAQLYVDVGQTQQAQQKIDEAIKLYEEYLGKNHIRTAKSLYLKGNLLLRRYPPEYQQAEELINRALEINLQIVGEDFLETADCYHILGKIKAQNLKSEDYLEYFTKSLTILERIYGNAHASIAILLNNLGKALCDRNNFEDAVQCFARSIKIYRSICGNVHGNLAITLKSSADCHKQLGRLKEAHHEYMQSLLIYEQIDNDFNCTKKQIKKLILETETED